MMLTGILVSSSAHRGLVTRQARQQHIKRTLCPLGTRSVTVLVQEAAGRICTHAIRTRCKLTGTQVVDNVGFCLALLSLYLEQNTTEEKVWEGMVEKTSTPNRK